MKKIIITENQLNVLLKKRTKQLKNRLIKEEMDMSQYDEDFLTPRAYITPENMGKAATELYYKLKRDKEGGKPSSDHETLMKDDDFESLTPEERFQYMVKITKNPGTEGESSSDYETAMKEKLGLNEPSSEEEMNIMKHGDRELEEYDDTISLDDFENMGSELSEYDSYLNEGQIKMKNVYKKYMKNPIIKGLSK